MGESSDTDAVRRRWKGRICQTEQQELRGSLRHSAQGGALQRPRITRRIKWPWASSKCKGPRARRIPGTGAQRRRARVLQQRYKEALNGEAPGHWGGSGVAFHVVAGPLR